MCLIEVKNVTLPCIEVFGVFSWRILLCFALKYWECSTEECYFAVHWSTGSVHFLRCQTSEPEINVGCSLQKPGIEMAASAWQILDNFLYGFGHCSCTPRTYVVSFGAEGLNMSAAWCNLYGGTCGVPVKALSVRKIMLKYSVYPATLIRSVWWQSRILTPSLRIQ